MNYLVRLVLSRLEYIRLVTFSFENKSPFVFAIKHYYSNFELGGIRQDCPKSEVVTENIDTLQKLMMVDYLRETETLKELYALIPPAIINYCMII